MNILFTLLTAQVVLGAADTLWHHEIQQHLPQRRGARHEVALHGCRELIYAGVFWGLAWRAWHGAWAWFVAAVLLLEIAITLADFLIEDRTRRLPSLERVLHTVLAINFGVVLAVLAPTLWRWSQLDTAVVATSYGAWSWALTIFALGVGIWGLRDMAATLRFARPPLWCRDPIRAGRKLQPRTVLVTGATGFIGRHVCRQTIQSGDRLIVLTRDRERAWDLYGPHARIVTSLQQIEATQRIDVVINLAGEPILATWWTASRRRQLLDSRLEVTNQVVALIARLQRKPKVLISASAIGYYGVRGDEDITEADRGRPIFQSHLCQAWELAAQGAENYGVRVCRLRLGLVLGRQGGALPGLSRPARFAMRIVLGSGSQWLSWIHIRDVLRLIDFCVQREDVHGGLNATSPEPTTQKEFAALLAARFGPSIELRIPARLLRLMLGEMAQLLVDGQKVLPMKAALGGFEFRCAALRDAFAELFPESGNEQAPVAIMYDSDCPICETEMGHYGRSAHCAGLQWRFDDIADRPELLSRYGLDTQTARRRVYVLSDEGQLISGIRALTLIWSALPHWRWLARLVRLPLLRELADYVYDLAVAPLIWRWSARRRARAIMAAARGQH